MKALITGASSGIGYDMSKYLSTLGYGIIAVARNTERLEKLKSEVKTDIEIISLDLSQAQNCKDLYESVRSQEIDILINNAGFGIFGEFSVSDLDREIEMIQTNITALHILTKLFYKDMLEKDKGTIMNVASLAGFLPGPLMAGYYASKAYVVRLTQAIREEAAAQKSKVHICLLCPGPVSTRFNDTAGVEIGLHSLPSAYVAKYAVDRMLRGRFMIMPGASIKTVRVLSKIFPDALTAKGALQMQRRKEKWHVQ